MSGSVPLRSPTPPAMANHPSSRFRISRTMPSWVTESSDRVGPAPPPPPVNMDPEYEVIDVANQQYSNTPPPIPVKSADIKRMTVMKCDLCGSVTPAVRCAQCDNNFFCASCDDRYHRHPKRQTHTRTPVELQTTPAAVAPTTTAVKPPLPPKGEAGTSGPLPPPRRNKRPGSFHFPSPLLGRKQDQDQTIPTTVPQGSISTQKPPQPPPSPALSLREKMNSLKRFIHPSNRPLPDPPENKIHSSTSSLDTVSKRSFSTGAPRSVSSTMEKIQNNTAATLDRMTMLQQRYRQHQETMRTDSDRSRRASLISNADMQSSSQTIRTKPPSVPSTILNQQQQQFHQQHLALQSRWNEPPTPRIRSGSVASGINLMPSASSPVPNESNAPSINNQSFMFPPQRTDLGGSPDPGLPNPRSTSVFNLNQMHQQPAQPNMWGFTPLQQAQSMAQMSFNQMGWNQMNPWMAGQTQNGSNMSLNMPSSQQGRYPPDPSRYPPGWNNAWGGMYPYPMGMMPMMHGMAMPPPRSRAHSRAASPALSIKSRKSTMSMRNRSSYINDLTDDEDSDEDFGKSRGRRDRRHRVNSNSSLDFDEPEPNSFVRASSVKHSRFNRDRRGTSSARSLIDYPTSYKRDIHRSKYDREELLRDRFDKMSLSSQRKVTSDSYTNDSDLETNRRGSNKSKPNNESLTTPRKITSDSLTNDSDGEIERRRVAKQSRSPSNVSSPMKVASDSFTNDSDAEFERRKQRKNSGLLSPKRMESDSLTGESDVGREKVKPVGIRKLSDTEKGKPVKPKASKTNPKKVPSDSHTPDTDGDQKRRFATKKPMKKNSSTEFIPNDSEPETDKQTEIKRKISIIVHEPPEIKSLSESNNENENDHSQSIEIKNQINETKPEAIQFTTEESPPPPPPIIAPNREWECAFCTYVNEAGVKICAICCKTVTVDVEAPTKIDPETPRSPPPDVVQEPPCEKRTVQNPTTDVKKLQTIIPPVAKEVDSKKKDNDDRFGGGVEQSDQVDEFLLEENQYENFEIQSALPVKLENPKGSGEIKQNLDSEVTKLVNKVVREKVSTGCGPSPPREFIEEKEAMDTVDSRPSSSARASIGTSPPPQDMSTQTYETFEKVREDSSTIESVQVQSSNNLTQPPSGGVYKRSHSLATPQLLQVANSRPDNIQQSFSTDTQSLPPTPHELSPQPHYVQQQNETHPSSIASPHHADESMSYLDRAINQIIQTAATRTNFGLTRPLDQHKYRAMNDLRRIDTVPSQAPPRPTTDNVELLHSRRKTTTNNMNEAPTNGTKMMEPLSSNGQNSSAENEFINLLKEASHYNFTTDELQAALSLCKDKHPVLWLRDNWSKLVDTVQTLATKYGHEKRENTIGTISSAEAREALRLHKGNIWHAITECIEQRQKKYHEIASKGNFTREDIVTSLTAHHGNMDLAMVELSKTQLKPFLMRIWGPPNGADNDSGNSLLQQALKEDRSGISTEIQEFISTHVEKELLPDKASECLSTVEVEVASSPEVKFHPNVDKTNHTTVNENGKCDVPDEESVTSNTLILRDIEKLIDQMEKNQENKNEDVLKNIQHLLTKLVEKSGSRPASQASVRSESCERIIVKSPIPLPRMNQPSESESKPIYEDIRNFMAENIQEVLPSLVDQVQQELRSVPIHTEKTLVDDIRETLMNADFSEEEYSVISNFPFNINDKDDMHDFPNIKKRSSMGFQTAQEDDNEYANIQDFIMRAIRTERLTNEFEQYKTNNYRFDSSSDEARNTAESADYYDIVAVNQRIQDLLNRNREVVTSLGSLEIEPPTSVDNPAEEAIYVNTAEINAFAATQHNSETSERKQVKKRRVSRIPVNKDNYLQRRPVKSSSESDFEAIAHNHKSPIPTVHVDHVEELRHVVENIEKIEQELDMLPNELDSPSVDVVQPIYDNVVDTEEIIEVETQPTPEIITSEQQPLSNHSLTCENVPDTSLIIPPNHEPHDQSTASEEINDTCEDVVSPHNVDHITEPSISPLHEVANSSIQSPVASVPLETPSVVVPEAVSQSPEPMLISPAEEPLQPLAASPTIIEIVDAPQLNTEPIKDEPVSISLPKPSNNLSDLVLDTKRLIQQMKDEIASDMATMEDEDDVYEDEYYEEDEYGDWTEGDEMMEEWDSNEEYDVDENGDFFEYEDEDDDGSVMFSEIAPEDVVHSVDQVEEKRIEESKPELPKINAAMVREMERNSASEVSDLPLDSDFNDTLSVIEQSFGEVTDILSLAVEGLTGNNQLDYDELSGADTVQNSPEISTISEVTLVADATDSTEATLVAEENMNLTMKNVQTLLNAKVVIGEFIKTAQHAGNSTVNLDPANQVQTGERTIHDLVQSGPSQSVAGVEKRATPEPHPQDSKVPETDTSDAMSNDAEQNHAEKETASATHVLDATIEMLNTVARDLSEQLQQVSPVPPIEEHNSQEITATENNVPEYATVNRNRVTGHLVNLEVDQKLDHEILEYVNIKQLQNMPTENGSTSVQTVVNGADDTITNGQSIQSVQSSASPTVAQIVEGSITCVNLITSKETVFNQISSEEIISETVSSKVDEIENTLNLVALSEENTDSVITTLNLEEQSIQPTERTSSQIQESSIQHVMNPNIGQTSMNQAQSTSINQEEVHKLLNPENTPSSIQLDLKDHVDEISSGEDASDVSIVASSTIHGQPDNNILAVHSEATHSVPPDNDSGHSSAITTDPDKRHTSDTTSTKDMSSPSNEQTLNNSVELHPVQNQIMETTRDSTTVFPAKTETLQSSSSNEDENTVEIVAEIINQISEIIQRSTVEEEIVPPILTNGVIHDATIRSSISREPSEDSSSFIEVHASQVIIHSPNGEEPSSQSSSEALTQSSNIYENVKASSSTRKPSPKSSSKSIKTPGPGTAQTSSQSTTSKKLTTPSSSSSPSGQKTTKLVKAKTKASTEIKKNTSTTSDSSSRRNSLRKNSIGSPFGPMQINSVKNMQKEFLNKTQKDSSKSPTITPKPKPSKLVQPKAFINNKLTNPITIPTQPNVAASTSKASTSSSGEPGSSRSTPGPSSSKCTTPGGSREGSVTSEQKRKLRKKYMETCFSDDYFTSDEDDECTTTVTENTESRTIIRSLVKPFEPSEEPLEVQARRLLDEGRVMSYQQAELAIQLIEMRYAHENAVWAATQCHTIEEAKNLLQKECELCLGTYPMNEIISMLKCTHTCCLDCAKVYFTEEIMHRSITNCNCPYCKEPDLNNADTTEDDVLEYFSNLDILLKNIVDEEVHDLFQRKLRDRTLMQDPNFKWCVDCSSGFFARPRQKRLICPDCGSITCSSCRKPWESQHEGISCEQFAAWKEANDPELQAQGVARHLQAHGISCPNCKFKYSLSRGGCMHFTCTQCKFEFCFGCNKPFMMGAKCDVSPYCAKLGLHAHHPRNCLFYLRDKDPKDLQTLLTMHNVTYNTEPSELMKREFLEGGAAAMQCPIPIQRENPAGGLMDTVCNGDVPDGYAGLCRAHYIEYLTFLVKSHGIDPLNVLNADDLESIVRRANKRMPPRPFGLVDGIYRDYLAQIVKEQIPLN
ncbi:E3 ubiquitin-protein ligase lubel isoform X2 [Armigeres subalbatus]|uniref:E3 ubiquitin-protein ligase lubel isoform X2 n=1 Tax=Armigeres subalbatus TaxID=124917 RepID=UPI002ECFBE7B